MLIGHSRENCILDWLGLIGAGFVLQNLSLSTSSFAFCCLMHKSQASGKLDKAPKNARVDEVAHLMQPFL